MATTKQAQQTPYDPEIAKLGSKNRTGRYNDLLCFKAGYLRAKAENADLLPEALVALALARKFMGLGGIPCDPQSLAKVDAVLKKAGRA